MRPSVSILTVMLMAIAATAMASGTSDHGNGKNSPKVYMEARTVPEKVYAGTPFCYTLTLYSSTSDIESVTAAGDFSIDGLRTVRYATSDGIMQMRRVEVKGREWYAVTVERAILVAPQSGTYRIEAPRFVAGIGELTTYVDPFWGPVRGTSVREVEVEAPEVRIKAKKIPDDVAAGLPVGEFSIIAELPEGDIVAGSEAIVVYTIKGSGDLQSAGTPALRAAFPEGLEYKSKSDDMRVAVSGDSLESCVETEAVFVPAKAGTYVIAPVEFRYFSPSRGRVVTVRSEPVTVKADEQKLPSSPPVIHCI